MFNRPAAALVVLVTVALAVGCSSEEEGDPGMKVEETCLKNQCDEMQATSANACSQCISACASASFDCDSSRSCAVSCGGKGPTCTDSDRDTCVERGFKATLPTTKSDAVAAACDEMFVRARLCGAINASSAPCEAWAKAERPEVAANYECIAALACGEDESSCEPPATDFGERFCDAMDAICGEVSCTEEQRAIINQDGGWLKESVQAAALACAAQSTCGDAQACMAAWITAVHR